MLPSHVLQIDNDMVIRSDCPSPFEFTQPGQFAMVAERQCTQNRIDNGGWQKTAHEIWAKRCRLKPAPTWMHPNGGLYLYDTETFARMFERIIQYLIVTFGRLHRMNLWLSKHHLRSPTSFGRGSHQIIPITCHQVITIPTICPRAIQVTILNIQSDCHGGHFTNRVERNVRLQRRRHSRET
jgi:hypothetical protein